MKKLLLVLILISVFISPAIGFSEWHPTNQVTIMWDAAPTATSYKIYIKSVNGGQEVEVGSTETLSYVLTIAKEGRYIIGVQSIRDNVETVPYSEISWSDDPETCLNSEIFGVVYYIPPEMPINLRVQE